LLVRDAVLPVHHLLNIKLLFLVIIHSLNTFNLKDFFQRFILACNFARVIEFWLRFYRDEPNKKERILIHLKKSLYLQDNHFFNFMILTDQLIVLKNDEDFRETQ